MLATSIIPSTSHVIKNSHTCSNALVQRPSPKTPKRTTQQTQQAWVVSSPGKCELRALSVPDVGPGEVMIRTFAVGLNHIDWMSIDYNFCIPAFPWITGREASGLVEKVGPTVKDWKKGDRVWTSTYYRDSRAGCFQELVVVPKHTVNSIPSSLTFEDAACLGVCALTAAMALWKWLGVPMDSDASSGTEQRETLLVWGGSTVTGQFVIQIARCCGLEVVAVTSERTKSLAQDLGADVAITRDHKTSEEIVSEIKAVAGARITRGIDCVGGRTASYALQAMSTDRPSLFVPLAMLDSKVQVPKNIRVQHVEMKQFVLDPSSREYATRLNRLVESGCLRLPEIQSMGVGLSAVEAGLGMLKQGNMGGRKLVISMVAGARNG